MAGQGSARRGKARLGSRGWCGLGGAGYGSQGWVRCGMAWHGWAVRAVVSHFMKTALALLALAALCQPAIPTAHADTLCARGLMAVGPTSCEFAYNVRSVYVATTGRVGGPAILYNVYSPATNASYVMNCTQFGAGVVCTGGNGAEVNIF